MSNMLNVTDLCWTRQQKAILQDVNFSVEKGAMLGIIGPNGAGKTSLLRCIQLMVNDYQGLIKFKGKSLKKYSRRTLAQQVAVVAQQSLPIFSLSVFDVVRMGLLPHKSLFSVDNQSDVHQIELALEKVGLLSFAYKKYAELSGGEQQRTLIARALVQGAQLLIMDEPTNHLDVYYQHQIMHLVKALNITVLMTVHDLNLAVQHCSRLLLLNKGQVVANGNVDKVLNTQILSEVFNLPCHLDTDPLNGLPRVSFSFTGEPK